MKSKTFREVFKNLSWSVILKSFFIIFFWLIVASISFSHLNDKYWHLNLDGLDIFSGLVLYRFLVKTLKNEIPTPE